MTEPEREAPETRPASRREQAAGLLVLAGFLAVALPVAFALGYLVFGGGWKDLPEPWRTRALVFGALLAAVIAIATWRRRVTQRAAHDDDASAEPPED